MTPVGGYIPFSYADLGALVFNINDRGISTIPMYI